MIFVAIIILSVNFGPALVTALANQANNRLITPGWQAAQASLTAAQPIYKTNYTYYKLREGQNLQWAAAHFGVSLTDLQALNPGQAVWGTTIKVPPVQRSLAPFSAAETTTAHITVSTTTAGALLLSNTFTNPTAYITVPLLMQLLQPYRAITQLGPKSFLIDQSIYIEGNIRTDITSATVRKLYLLSNPDYHITALTFWDSEALLSGITVSSYNTQSKSPDTSYEDGRSFLRAYGNARMDILHSTIAYLGMAKMRGTTGIPQAARALLLGGETDGVSWGIADGSYGTNDTTGWVENSSFTANYSGASTHGAQGMMWRNNLFMKNTAYGLDASNNSNNATIVDNHFLENGIDGFRASSHSDYNIITNNESTDNKRNGFLLYNHSDRNVIANNTVVTNHNSFGISASDLNTIKNNASYNPQGSHVRISAASTQNYVTGNTFYGGPRGIYVYGKDNGVEIAYNTFDATPYQLITNGANRVLFNGNQSNSLGYKLASSDRVVFGVNKLDAYIHIDLNPLQTATHNVTSTAVRHKS